MNFDMQPKNLRFFVWGTILFFCFLILLFLETQQIFLTIDPIITAFFQKIIPPSAIIPLSVFSLLGIFEITSLAVILIGLFIFKKERKIYYPLVFFGLILVFELIGKIFLYHPGPPKEFFRFYLPFSFPSVHVDTAYSFPSGHVSRTLFLVVILLFLFTTHIKNVGKKFLLTASCYLLAALMIISRIYLGEHWASDVLGGIFLGASMGLLTLVYY